MKLKQVELRYGIQRDQLQSTMNLALKGMEAEQKEYWRQKDLEDKAILTAMDTQQRKEIMDYENQLNLDYYKSTQ